MKSSFIQLRPSLIIKTAAYSFFSVLIICILSSFLPALGYMGARPDMLLCAVIALSYFESEKTAAVFGMLSGFVLEAAGGVGISILPLFYMLSGCICALMFLRLLGKNFGIYMLYVSLFSLVRAAITLIYIQLGTEDLSLDLAFSNILFPEFALTLVTAPLMFLSVYLISKRTDPKKDIQELRV